MKKLETDIREFSDLLKVGQSRVGQPRRARSWTQLKDKERELEELKLKNGQPARRSSLQAKTIAGVQVHVQRTDGLDVKRHAGAGRSAAG